MTRKEMMSFLNNRAAVEEMRASENFKKSNHCWNVQSYNKKRSIGYLMKLINDCHPRTLEDWVHFYLSDGYELELEMLENPDVFVKERGRSFRYLKGIARRFQQDLADYSEIEISEDEAFKYVLIRVFYETFDGYLREKNTKFTLQGFFKHYIVATENSAVGIDAAKLDIDYAVDCLMVGRDGTPKCGIQIKSNNFATPSAKKMNNYKHERFEKETGLPVFYIYADYRGRMEESSLKDLHSYLKKTSFQKERVVA